MSASQWTSRISLTSTKAAKFIGIQSFKEKMIKDLSKKDDLECSGWTSHLFTFAIPASRQHQPWAEQSTFNFAQLGLDSLFILHPWSQSVWSGNKGNGCWLVVSFKDLEDYPSLLADIDIASLGLVYWQCTKRASYRQWHKLKDYTFFVLLSHSMMAHNRLRRFSSILLGPIKETSDTVRMRECKK